MPVIETSLRPWPVSQQAHRRATDAMEMCPQRNQPGLISVSSRVACEEKQVEVQAPALAIGVCQLPIDTQCRDAHLFFPSQTSDGATIVRATSGRAVGLWIGTGATFSMPPSLHPPTVSSALRSPLGIDRPFSNGRIKLPRVLDAETELCSQPIPVAGT